MPFDTFTPRMKQVAEGGVSYCTRRFGRTGLKKEEEIHKSISWRPTFSLKANTSLIVAVEASEVLYPSILKQAAHDIRTYDFPVAVILACPLEVYLADTKQTSVRQLRNDGFGLLTIGEQGQAMLQHSWQPLAEHISEKELEEGIKALKPKLKVALRAAHETYRTNVSQGVQEAGQLIEALIVSLATQSAGAGWVGAGLAKEAAAKIIDSLYLLDEPSHKKDFVHKRAALGAARTFVSQYRNVVSHPSRTPKEAINKIRACRKGFLDALGVIVQLQDVLEAKGFKVRLHS